MSAILEARAIKANDEARMTNDETNSKVQMTNDSNKPFRAIEHSCIDSNFVIRNSSFPRRRAMSLIEVMISLAITASLLSAVAVAFRASADAVDANDQCTRAIQAARVSVSQIMTEARRCQTGVVGAS